MEPVVSKHVRGNILLKELYKVGYRHSSAERAFTYSEIYYMNRIINQLSEK